MIVANRLREIAAEIDSAERCMLAHELRSIASTIEKDAADLSVAVANADSFFTRNIDERPHILGNLQGSALAFIGRINGHNRRHAA